VEVLSFVGAVVPIGARRLRHELDVLVIANRHYLDAGCLRQSSDTQSSVHAHQLDPIVTIGLILNQ
jgi:hypothetical protein